MCVSVFVFNPGLNSSARLTMNSLIALSFFEPCCVQGVPCITVACLFNRSHNFGLSVELMHSSHE